MDQKLANAILRRVEALERTEATTPGPSREGLVRSAKVIAVLDDGRVNVREIGPTGAEGKAWIGLRAPGSPGVGAQVELQFMSYDPVPRILAGGGSGVADGWFTVRSFDFQTLIFGS